MKFGRLQLMLIKLHPEEITPDPPSASALGVGLDVAPGDAERPPISAA
jgi:hypothetical protein